MSLPEAERLARLRLARTDGVGPVTFRRLLARFGSAARAIASWRDLAGAPGPLAPAEVVQAEVDAAARVGACHVVWGEPLYPPRLAELADPPPVLVLRGDASLAIRPAVAIVGARNASAAGRALAGELARDLGQAGFVVVSGLARGIDAAAHQAALATGTVACVAGGIDVPSPPEHAALHEAIGRQGLLVSEQPPGTEPQARHFPRRNRLIAGLAQGVVVIEAAHGSGSLITARLAAEAGREVMAVPGHPRDPRARGGNALLKSGATLVEDAADVLAALAPFAAAGRPAAEPVTTSPDADPAGDPADARGRLLELLSATPVATDELVRMSGLPTGHVAALLVDLELEGRIVRHAGGRVALA